MAPSRQPLVLARATGKPGAGAVLQAQFALGDESFNGQIPSVWFIDNCTEWKLTSALYESVVLRVPTVRPAPQSGLDRFRLLVSPRRSAFCLCGLLFRTSHVHRST